MMSEDLQAVMMQGLCRDLDPDYMWIDNADEAHKRKATCMPCPVRFECLIHALNKKEDFGIWGGMTHLERHKLLRQYPKVDDWARVYRHMIQAQREFAKKIAEREAAANGSEQSRRLHDLRNEDVQVQSSGEAEVAKAQEGPAFDLAADLFLDEPDLAGTFTFAQEELPTSQRPNIGKPGSRSRAGVTPKSVRPRTASSSDAGASSGGARPRIRSVQ